MRLTCKAKKQFELYLGSLPYKFSSGITGVVFNPITFYSLPLSMQWGVYQDWADSIGYYTSITCIDFGSLYFSAYIEINGIIEWESEFKTRQEARNAAIEKLNQIINAQ